MPVQGIIRWPRIFSGMQGTCVILVHNDSPGIWKLPGALWQLLRVPGIFWGFVTIPGFAWQLQGPVALFFMASERRICRLIVGKSFGEKETAWKGLYLEAHLQDLTRQQGDVAGSPLPPEAWGSQGVWIPYGLFPSGKLKISHSGRSAGSTVLTCRPVTWRGPRMHLLPGYGGTAPQSPPSRCIVQGPEVAAAHEGAGTPPLTDTSISPSMGSGELSLPRPASLG